MVYRDDDPALSTVFANCSHRPTRVDHGRKYVACWRARCVELPALSVARGQNWLQTGAVSAERAQHQRGRSLPRRGPSSPSRAPRHTPCPRHPGTQRVCFAESKKLGAHKCRRSRSLPDWVENSRPSQSTAVCDVDPRLLLRSLSSCFFPTLSRACSAQEVKKLDVKYNVRTSPF